MIPGRASSSLCPPEVIIVYCRVSSKKQVEGAGLASQLQSAMNAAGTVFNALGGYVIGEVFKEAVRKGAPKGTNGGHAAL